MIWVDESELIVVILCSSYVILLLAVAAVFVTVFVKLNTVINVARCTSNMCENVVLCWSGCVCVYRVITEVSFGGCYVCLWLCLCVWQGVWVCLSLCRLYMLWWICMEPSLQCHYVVRWLMYPSLVLRLFHTVRPMCWLWLMLGLLIPVNMLQLLPIQLQQQYHQQ